MTQREELINSDHWDEYETYIRSGGQDPCLRESFLIRHITALTLRIQEFEEGQQWRKFDKDDETTHPNIEAAPAFFLLWTPSLAGFYHVVSGYARHL